MKDITEIRSNLSNIKAEIKDALTRLDGVENDLIRYKQNLKHNQIQIDDVMYDKKLGFGRVTAIDNIKIYFAHAWTQNDTITNVDKNSTIGKRLRKATTTELEKLRNI